MFHSQDFYLSAYTDLHNTDPRAYGKQYLHRNRKAAFIPAYLPDIPYAGDNTDTRQIRDIRIHACISALLPDILTGIHRSGTVHSRDAGTEMDIYE